MLFNIQPILIFDNVDNPKNTVRPIQALNRLNHLKIGNVAFSETDQRRIQKAVELRNEMTHGEFDLQSEYATAKFFEVFAFVVHFQACHLKTEIETIIPKESLDKLLDIRKSFKELAEKAKQRISEEEIDAEFVFECPNCQNDTFVFQDDINTCYTCRHTEEIFECKKCSNFFFDEEMEDFSNEFDTDCSEGVIDNDFGYDYYNACTECVAEIKEDIAKQRADEQYEWEEEQYYKEMEWEMKQYYKEM